MMHIEKNTSTGFHIHTSLLEDQFLLVVHQPVDKESGEPVTFADLNTSTHCRGYLYVSLSEVNTLLENLPRIRSNYQNRDLASSLGSFNYPDSRKRLTQGNVVLLPFSGTFNGVMHRINGLDNNAFGAVASILQLRSQHDDNAPSDSLVKETSEIQADDSAEFAPEHHENTYSKSESVLTGTLLEHAEAMKAKFDLLVPPSTLIPTQQIETTATKDAIQSTDLASTPEQAKYEVNPLLESLESLSIL